jgi:hypothetical protein
VLADRGADQVWEKIQGEITMLIRSLTVSVFVLSLLLSLATIFSPPALADANEHASCAGLESSSISPPGSSDEEPGGRAQLAHELKGLAGQYQVPPGAIVTDLAHSHAGSHDLCDAPPA